MNPLTVLAVAVLGGGGIAAGALLTLSSVPRWRSVSLTARIAPYLRDIVDLPEGRRSGSLRLPVPEVWSRTIRALPGLVGAGDPTVATRLAQAGDALDVRAFRARQLVWIVSGLALGAIAAIVVALTGRMSLPTVLLPLIGAFGALATSDMILAARARRRIARIAEELPTVLEFLALCLSAGEGLLDALRRVARTGSGELGAELRTALVEVGTGVGLADALIGSAQRLQIPAHARAVDQIVAALERGAPLASVLQAQAGDAREDAKRGLIEQAGRKEILMLLPLVFLILPLSVVFAIFPGLVILRAGIG